MKKLLLATLLTTTIYTAESKLVNNIKDYFILTHKKNMDEVIHQDDAKDSISAEIMGYEIICEWDRESKQTPTHKYSIVEVYLLESVELMYERKS